jgi:hypothetical protein
MLVACGGGQLTSSSGGGSTPPTTKGYFGTEASHATFLPRSDSYCAAAVTPNSWEPRPDNDQANHTVLNPPYNWSVENYWTLWRAKRDKVTGNFTGTTTDIIQWAACKWGIDEDTIRADAVQESYWHMSTIGDVCGPAGEGSYGLMQIKNEDCSGTVVHGGYPYTAQSTALNVDWYAAHIRSCYDSISTTEATGFTLGRRSIRSQLSTAGTMCFGLASVPISLETGSRDSPTSCRFSRFSRTARGISRTSSPCCGKKP